MTAFAVGAPSKATDSILVTDSATALRTHIL